MSISSPLRGAFKGLYHPESASSEIAGNTECVIWRQMLKTEQTASVQHTVIFMYVVQGEYRYSLLFLCAVTQLNNWQDLHILALVYYLRFCISQHLRIPREKSFCRRGKCPSGYYRKSLTDKEVDEGCWWKVSAHGVDIWILCSFTLEKQISALEYLCHIYILHSVLICITHFIFLTFWFSANTQDRAVLGSVMKQRKYIWTQVTGEECSTFAQLWN